MDARAVYKYHGLIVTCDPATVDRLHTLLRAELAVGIPVPEGAIRYVTVRMEMDSPKHRTSWLSVASFVLGGAAAGLITVVGLYTIIEWVCRWLA